MYTRVHTTMCKVVVCSCVLGMLIHANNCNAAQVDRDIALEFDRKITAWKNYLMNNPRLSNLTGNEHYRAIVDMGIPVLPYLMERIDKGSWALGGAVCLITEKRFEESEWPEGKLGDAISGAGLLREWWPKSRKETPARFSKLYSQWKELRRQNKKDEVSNKLRQIRNLGLAALPEIMDQIIHGDRELISIVSTLTRGKVDPNATTDQCVAWWGKNKEKWLIPFPNKQPVAEAGVARNVEAGSTVELDGSKSADPDKDPLKYRWRQIIGPDVELSDPDAITPTFTAPDVDRPTMLVFELTVDDGYRAESVHPTCESGHSKPDTVTITVTPK